MKPKSRYRDWCLLLIGALIPFIIHGKIAASELTIIADVTPAFFLGNTIAAKSAGLPADEVTRWSLLSRVIEGNIYLVGEEDPA